MQVIIYLFSPKHRACKVHIRALNHKEIFFLFLFSFNFLYTHFCFWLHYFCFNSYTEGIVGCLRSRQLILLLTSKTILADLQLQGNCWGLFSPKAQLILSSRQRCKRRRQQLQTKRAKTSHRSIDGIHLLTLWLPRWERRTLGFFTRQEIHLGNWLCISL